MSSNIQASAHLSFPSYLKGLLPNLIQDINKVPCTNSHLLMSLKSLLVYSWVLMELLEPFKPSDLTEGSRKPCSQAKLKEKLSDLT